MSLRPDEFCSTEKSPNSTKDKDVQAPVWVCILSLRKKSSFPRGTKSRLPARKSVALSLEQLTDSGRSSVNTDLLMCEVKAMEG
jgi:hypothetical protein